MVTQAPDADLLESRGYPSLQMTRHEFPDETHLLVSPATFSRGLRAVFGDAGSRAWLGGGEPLISSIVLLH